VLERFGAAGVPKEQVAFARDTYTFDFDGPPAAFVAAFRDYYGPTMNAFDAAAKKRPGRCAAGRARGAVQEPEPERPRRPHDRRRDVPARDGDGALSGRRR
jgi:hypothetical protein